MQATSPNELAANTNRPEGQRDRAAPLSYGDLILLSCQFDESVGYLCEHGCVMKKCNDIEMDASSRELVFEVCTAADNRALVEYTTYVRKHGYRADDMRLKHLEGQKNLEEHGNESQAVHMVGRTVSYGDTIQLRQPKSHGFLGVDIGQAPRQEATAKRVVLHTSRGRPVAFRIMPRFKYLVEGHTVCHGDRIALVSTEFPGEYVHAHMGFESLPSVGVVHEVHLAAPSTKNPVTAWVVDSFFPHAMQSAQHVKAGDVVRLYHPYHAAFVAVTTCDATVFLESSHSALASTMWVICDEDPLAGGLVRMQHSYSFMHLVTRKFLVVKDLDKLMPQLKIQDVAGAAGDADETQCLFSAVEVNSDKKKEVLMTLKPLEDDSKDMHLAWGGRVRLVHTSSRQYLHCMSTHQLKSPIRALPKEQTDELVRKRGLTHLAEGADGQGKARPGGNLPERLLVASPALFREDSFDVVKVAAEQVRAVDMLANCLPVLERYLEQLQDDLEAHRALDSLPGESAPLCFPDDHILDVIERLTELQAYVYASGYVAAESREERSRGEGAAAEDGASLAQPLAYCQNFMRDLGVAELLIAILQHSYNILFQQTDDQMDMEDYKKEQQADLDGGASFTSAVAVSERSALSSVLSVSAGGAPADSEESKLETEKKMKEVLQLARNRTGRLVWQLCYGVLYHMVHKHADNANYLARYMSLIQNQLFLELGAEKLLLQMLGDNETLLNAMASDATKEEHVHFHRKALIDGGKNAMHLRFLAAMCACGDRGISRHQDLVLPYLLSNQSKILLEVTVVHQALKLRDWYYDLSDLPEDAQDLGELCSGSLRQTEKGAKQKRMLDYFVESLLLLATLCKPDSSGRRDFVVQKVRHFLTLSQCKMCLENELLPEHLRRNMCEFVRVVYVQDDSFNKVTRLSGVCIWSDLEAQEKPPAAARGSTRGSSAAASDQKVDGDALSQDAEAGTDMQDLKNIIREYLSQNACQYYPGRTPHSNPLKLSMIRLCRELVLYGHYLESELVGVVKEACIILDFSSMRFIDESKGESLGSMAASKQQDTFQGVLTEQTVSLALQHLRPLCKNIAPIEMARFRSVFKCRVYETGDLMVEAGENAADMFVIQSGAAFMLQTTDGVDSVVDTVGQGEVFGVDTLSRDKKTWPWRVRCSQRVTALHLSAQALYNVSSEMARTGKLSMTDGLEVVLETKREACALINDIYDLRLRVRTMKMLQEYRFDLNISQKVYTRENLTGTGDDLEAGDILALLPQKLASHQLVIPQDFYIDDTPVLGSFLSQRLKPMESFVLGWPRIDRAVLVVAILQYLLAAVLMLLMALRIKSLLEEQSPDAALADDAVRPASASLGVHPGLSRPVAPLVVNLVLTLLWSVTQLGVAWSALSHARTGKEVTVANSEGDKFVQYMTNPLGAQIGFVAQFAYLLFWVANTATGLVAGLMALGNGAAGASSAVLTQALWLVLGTGLGLYNGLAFASLYVHLQRPALFLQDTSQEEEQGEQVEADLPRREFLKILEYLDLDDNGALSQTLADLIISPYKPLVVDAFNLLVRTHDSNRQLHAQLVNMLILDSSAEIADPKRLMYISDELTKALLGVTNAMQAYVVERSNEQMRLKEKKEHAKQQAARQARARSTQLTAKQRELEVQRNDEMARLRKEREQQEQSDSKTQASHIKEVEPLLNQLLTMMDDKVRAREKVQRRLLQRKGMHWIVLRLLACLPADFTETTGPLCYRALARLCDGAPNIQAELAQHVHVFYAHFDSIPHEVAFVLSAIYKDNVNLCYTVEEYMMKKIAALIKDDLAAPYLMLAKIIITPKDQIVRRNQNLIIKHLDSLDVQLLLFQGGAKALRKTLLSDSSAETPASSLAPVSRGKSAKATKMLQVHIGSIELLTACMAEYNHDNKKRCRGGNPNLTLTLADVEADLYDRELPVSVKRALLDFLVQAYILVDMSNINLLMQPEITNVFDQLARWIELLPVDTRGSKVTRLTKSERSLLTDTYMAAAKAFFSTLPASDLRQRESGRVRVGGRLLEALVELLLSCRPGGTSQSDLQGEEELRILEVVMLLARSIKDSFERYPLLVGQKEGSRLRKVLGASELTLNEDDDEENAPPEGKCERQIQLKDEMTLEHERSKHLPLSVSEGMVVFGNDFLSVMSGPGSPSNEFDTLCAAFLQAKPLVQMGPVATRGADAAKGDTGGGPAGAAGGGDDEMPVSNQHLESLVDLMTTCESLTAEMQQTGLLIIGKVVKSVKFLDDGVEDRKEQRDWLHTGVPKMLVRLITAASSNDSIVRECLKIAIEFLESGKRPAQDAFYTLLTSTTSEVSLFQKLRDRLVRGERGLGIYQATFLRLSQELHSQCSTLGKVLTIEGVRRLTQADRLVQSFLGSYPEEVLRFLQLLCEGHNKDMQEYMQYQGKTSVDMVSCAADFVAACSRHMHPASISFANQCVQTLIEFVQNPCYRNQRALVDTQLPHVLNQFLQLSPDLPVEFFDVDTYLTDISTLKRNSVTLLLSLLERVDDRFIPSRILKALEMEKILASINALRAGYLGLEPGEEPPEDDEEASAGVAHESIAEHEDFQVACALFMLVRMLQYFDEDKLSGLSSKCNKNYIYDMERLQANCGFIEISRDNRLERIFFQIPPVCRYLSPASKNAILRDVNRENHQDQLLDFVERAHVRYDEMVHLQDLHRSSLYQCFLMVSGHLDVTFFLNAVLINLLALFSYRYRDAQFATLEYPSNIIIDSPWDEMILALSILQLFISIARLMGYYLESGVLRVKRIFTTDDDYYKVATEEYGGPRYYKLFTKILLSDAYFLLLTFYLALNLVALVLRWQTRLSMFVLMMHLVDMFNLSPSLTNVTTAVSASGRTLLQTAFLAFVMMYIYSAVGFVMFAEYFSFEAAEVEGGDEKDYNVNAARCDTIWKCFIVTVDMGLRKGDIGGALEDIAWRDVVPGTFIEECDSPPGLEYMGCLGIGGNDVGPFIFLRILYTSTFFIFINTILINIIFGVIIDTFGDLRERNQAMEEEMEHRCFICGLERYKFEINSSDGNGFAKHIREDHNMWIYLYFMIYLWTKEYDDQTGFETYVFLKLNEILSDGERQHKRAPDVSWFPNSEAMAIPDLRAANNDLILSSRLDALSASAQALMREGNARMQAMLHAAEQLLLHKGPATIYEENEDESSGDEDIADRILAAAGAAAAEGVQAAGAIASQGVEHLLNVSHDLAQGAENVGAHVSPAMLEAYHTYASQLAQLADEGYDNVEECLRLLELYSGDVGRVMQALSSQDHDLEDAQQDQDVGDPHLLDPARTEHDAYGEGDMHGATSGANNWV